MGERDPSGTEHRRRHLPRHLRRGPRRGERHARPRRRGGRLARCALHPGEGPRRARRLRWSAQLADRLERDRPALPRARLAARHRDLPQLRLEGHRRAVRGVDRRAPAGGAGAVRSGPLRRAGRHPRRPGRRPGGERRGPGGGHRAQAAQGHGDRSGRSRHPQRRLVLRQPGAGRARAGRGGGGRPGQERAADPGAALRGHRVGGRPGQGTRGLADRAGRVRQGLQPGRRRPDLLQAHPGPGQRRIRQHVRINTTPRHVPALRW